MAREWILNHAMNRFQLNFKRNVGATSESIRKCAPRTKEEWRAYYFNEVRSQNHIRDLGKQLYIKITEVLPAEIREITEQDCIDYMMRMVIDNTYQGYTNEIKTVYGQLEEALQHDIHPAPDEWDRLYNVDFYIKIGNSYIGLQIKPVDRHIQMSQIYKEKNIQQRTHRSWEQKHGGKVFYVYSSAGTDNKKTIKNTEVIGHIQKEISRLRQREDEAGAT